MFTLGTGGTGFTNLYNFTALAYDNDLFANTNLDGANPYAGLVLADGYVYGTACYGGSTGEGVVFALSVVAAAPPLDIHFDGTSMVIAWPSSESGWTLEQCTNLSAGVWSSCGQTVSDDGTSKSVSIPPTTGNVFFRLSHP